MKKYFAKRLSSTDLTEPNVFTFIKPLVDTEVKIIKTKIVLYNSPTFGNLKASIWEVANNQLINKISESSNQFFNQDITLAANAVKEIYFSFNNGVTIKANATYAIALFCSSYSGNANSHIAWVKEIVDQTYTVTGTTLNQKNLNKLPYWISLIGSK